MAGLSCDLREDNTLVGDAYSQLLPRENHTNTHVIMTRSHTKPTHTLISTASNPTNTPDVHTSSESPPEQEPSSSLDGPSYSTLPSHEASTTQRKPISEDSGSVGATKDSDTTKNINTVGDRDTIEDIEVVGDMKRLTTLKPIKVIVKINKRPIDIGM